MSTGISLSPYLNGRSDWGKINELSRSIFQEGHLEKLDDLLILILPIVNMAYFKYARKLDDRYYAREDLIQSASLEIYKDMKLRWDKYINIDNYPKYFEMISKNVMLNLVQFHHNYYKNIEFNPDLMYDMTSARDSFKYSEAKILRDTFNESVLEDTRRFARYHSKYARILEAMITSMYVEGDKELLKLKSKLRVLGINREIFNHLYDHVIYLHLLSYNYNKASIKGNNKMILRIEEIIRRFESPTYAILTKEYGDSIIPEIYAELGAEGTKNFVKVFSGKTVQVPDYQEFCDSMLCGTVYSLAKGDKDNLYQVAADYKFPYKTLSRIFNRADKFFKGGN